MALVFVAGALAPAHVRAQIPQRPDTVRTPTDTLPPPTDTLPQRPDTLPADSMAQDTLPPPPPPPLPPMLDPMPAGFATGVWVWDRAALQSEPYLSVNDLLDRVPGVITLRSGFHLQPEAASTWGATAGGIEVVLDGYTLWPLADPTFDLAQIELGSLESVRIERRAAGLRIVLRTTEAFSGEPYTRIEAGIGEPIGVNLFRGQFLAPHVFFGPLGLAVERFESEGIDGNETADMFSGWLKWGLTRERYGAQIEYRQQSLQRELPSPFAREMDRRDVLVRGRWIATDGLTFEAYGGHSRVEVTEADADENDVPVARDVLQIGTRGAFARGPLALEAGFRFNNERLIPVTEIEARSWLQLGMLGVGGEVHRSSWRDGDATLGWLLHATFTPIPAISLFAQYGGGDQGAPAWGDSARTIFESGHTLLRAGGQLRTLGADVGAALLSVERDSLFGFELPFDTAAVPIAADRLRGWELYGRVPLFRDVFYVDGALTSWFDWTTSFYTPTRSWRAALNAHISPLESGNLDVLTRIEARQRGIVSLPTASAEGDIVQRDLAPERTTFDWWLRIQILSVQAFLRYEDLTGERAADFPGRGLPGPRILYGVKWYFYN
jgi:hypothetical protein